MRLLVQLKVQWFYWMQLKTNMFIDLFVFSFTWLSYEKYRLQTHPGTTWPPLGFMKDTYPKYSIKISITCMHLADAFIQSDLYSGYTFIYQYVIIIL